MIQLKKNGMKTLKVIHLLTACCWFGGAVSLSVLNLSNHQAASAEEALYGLNLAGHLIDIWVVVNFGALGCLLTGLLYSILTPWGFFKHRWVMFKWIFTIACILSGTFFLGVWEGEMVRISNELGNAAITDAFYLAIKDKHFQLSCLQLSALIFMVAISAVKPWGKRGA